jgi:Elongation factor Tu C-terminal domain
MLFPNLHKALSLPASLPQTLHYSSMTTEEFVNNFYLERKRIIESSFDLNSDLRSYVSTKIEDLNLDKEQTEKFKHIISSLLTDTFYGILLGLDGSATIGNKQETFKIYSENHTLISNCGELEGEAYEMFIDNRLEFENSNCDFIAQLFFRKTEDGGRENYALSGYRPQIKFPFTEMQTSGQQTYIENNMVFPGDNVNALIKLTSTEHLSGQLKIGTKFEFLEGDKQIGTGRILKIKNEDLIKASR